MGSIGSIVRKITKLLNYEKYLQKQGVKMGSRCEIHKTSSFGSEPYLIELGNHVRINYGVCLVTHDGGYWVLRDKNAGYGTEFCNADRFGTIKIDDNVHIGTNAIIMPGVTIGQNSIIACGAVVTHNVPPNSVWGGVPARQIETLEQYAEKARKKAIPKKNMTANDKKKYILEHIANVENRK